MKKIFVFLILLLLSMSVVSAVSDNATMCSASNSDCIDLKSDSSYVYDSQLLGAESKATDNIIINQRNYKMYFDDNNVLKKDYNGKVLTFQGSFVDKGVFTIDGENTKITGKNTLFNNTVFNIKANGIMLTNLNFVLNKEFSNNEFAGILINADNVTVYNVALNYTVPKNCTGFGIYSNGLDKDLSDVKLVNNTVYMYGNALHEGYNYGVVLINTRDAIVSGNKINCSLPLRPVDWMAEIYGGISMEAVTGFAADSCFNLRLSNNDIYCEVNGVALGEPTLDAVIIYACHNSTIEHNTITQRDYITKKGEVNYLYGLDVFLCNNVIIYGNTIDIYTTGGKEAHGTAYPIQVTGQAENITIAFNRLTSFSNGPNIGIYSQNYYGITQLEIISNFINITGFASKHQWALVAGIELQDSNDVVFNNTIIVSTVNKFEKGFNVYGVSYSQTTNGDHKYNIQYNNVTVNGDYAVALKGGSGSTVTDSIVANNILNANNYGGNRVVTISGGSNNVIVNNTDGSKPVAVMDVDKYSDSLKSYLNSPFKGTGLSLGWLNSDSASNGISSNNTNANDVIGNNPNNSSSQSTKGQLNSTHYAYGSSGISIASASSASAGGNGILAGNDQQKSYEVSKKIDNSKDEFNLRFIICVLFIIALLVVGYKAKRTKEEY